MARKKKSSIESLIDSTKKYKTKRGRKKLLGKLIIYSILWVCLLCSLLFSTNIEKNINKTNFSFDSTIATGNYKVHYIDVGQGDSALIQFPDGKNMLIDTGDPSAKNNLVRYIDALQITQIDYFVITHPDSDHVGNAVTIFEQYDIVNVYIPTIYSLYEQENGLCTEDFALKNTKTWSNVVQAIYKEKETTLKSIVYNRPGVEIVAENYRVDFYSPLQDNLGTSDWNAYSPIMMVNIENVKYMFVGDASINDESEFLSHYASDVAVEKFNCDVLKVGHHGSGTSTCSEFLDAVKPKYAVISVGKDNKYGHPTQEVLDRLTKFNSQIMRTDLLGSIVFGEGGNQVVASQSNYNHVDDTYYEWKYFVICGGIVLAIGFIFVIKTSKDEKEAKEEKEKQKASGTKSGKKVGK